MIIDFITYASTHISDKGEIINQLFPNLWVFISHILATILLIIAMVKLAWHPTKEYIKKRTLDIQKNMIESENIRLEAEKNLELAKQKLFESKETASIILENAELEAEEKRKKIELAAINKANHIEKESLSSIKKQEMELSKRMNLEVSKLALETAEIFLSKKIDEEENKKLVDQIVKDLTERIENQSNNK